MTVHVPLYNDSVDRRIHGATVLDQNRTLALTWIRAFEPQKWRYMFYPLNCRQSQLQRKTS